MIVNVLLFAAAREMVGQSQIQVEMAGESTVAELRDLLQERYPQMKTLLSSSNWSLNQAYVGLEQVLADDCQVGVIPPVSGG